MAVTRREETPRSGAARGGPGAADSDSSTDSEEPGNLQRWHVVAGSRTGLVVRRDAGLKSPELSGRLKAGAVVEQLALVGERLHYRRISGEGPDFGWVSLSFKGLRLLEKLGKAGEQDSEAGAWSVGLSARGRDARRQSPYRAPAPAAVIASGEASPAKRELTGTSRAVTAPSPRRSSGKGAEARGLGGALRGRAAPAEEREEDEEVPSLDGEWDCLCDYKKDGGEAPLVMRIEGSVGKYNLAGGCHRLFDIAPRREGTTVVVNFRWANVNGQTGSGSWTLLEPRTMRGQRESELQRLEGWWAQDGTHGTWAWSGKRRPLSAPSVFRPSVGAGAERTERPAAAGPPAPGAAEPRREADAPAGQGEEATFEVIHERVAVRSRPSVDGEMLYALRKGTRVRGLLFQVAQVPWLRLAQEARLLRPMDEAWVLVDAARTKLGLGLLLRRVAKEVGSEVAEEASALELELREVSLGEAEQQDGLVEEARALGRRSLSASASMLSRGTAGGSRLAIARLPGAQRRAVAGYCLFHVEKDGGTFCLDEIVVAEELRHRGVGRRLVQWAVDAAVEAHCLVLTVSCPEDLAPFFHCHGLVASQEKASEGLKRMELVPSHGASIRRYERVAAGAAESRRAQRGGGGQEPEASVPVACFLASHLANEERLERFADLLASVAGQEPTGPPALFVSWSASGVQLRSRVRALLRGAASEIPSLTAGEQEAPLTQFQHFAACMGMADGMLGKEGWVLFSDDDDLWHPKRYAEYLGAISRVCAHSETVAVIGKGHAILCRPCRPRAVGPADVERLLESGGSRLSGTQTLGFQGQGAGSTSEEVDFGSGPGPEYFDIAIRAPQLRSFLRTTPKRILAHKFCDRHFLHRYYVPYEGRAHYFNPVGWLYFYSRLSAFSRSEGDGYAGGASFGVDVGGADRQLAESYAAREDCGLGVEEAAFVAAVLRASLEEMLVSKAAIREKTITKDLLENVCRRAARQHSVWLETEQTGVDAYILDLAREVGVEVCETLGVSV